MTTLEIILLILLAIACFFTWKFWREKEAWKRGFQENAFRQVLFPSPVANIMRLSAYLLIGISLVKLIQKYKQENK